MGGTTSHPINPGYWLLLSHHHLDVLSESWMKWGWLAEGTAKPRDPANSWQTGTPSGPWQPKGTFP